MLFWRLTLLLRQLANKTVYIFLSGNFTHLTLLNSTIYAKQHDGPDREFPDPSPRKKF